ncbi:MAG: MFS transporter [Rhodospirillaceae bacterium]|nr:MFS transporter [Rhodospirillaceae bacterium]
MTAPAPPPPAPGPMPDRFTGRIAATLFFAVMIMVVGQSCLFVILPPIGRQIGLAEYQIGMVMSVHGLVMLFTGPLSGAASDAWGRRRVIVFGSALAALSILAFGFIVDAGLSAAITGFTVMLLLMASRTVFAVGAGAVTPGAMALAADLSARENRLKAMSLLAAATSTGAMLGPSSAAFFSGLGLAAPFYVIGGFALLAVAAGRFVLPVTRTGGARAARGMIHLLKGRVLRVSLASLCFMCGNFGIFSVLGFFVQDHFGLDASAAARWMGLGLMGAAGMNVLVQWAIIGRWRMNPRAMIAVGTICTVASYVGAYMAAQPWLFVAAVMLNGFGQGFVNPALQTALSLSVGAADQGRIAGLSTATQAMAFLVAPVSSAVLYGLNAPTPFIVGVILIALGGVVVPARREPATSEA